ncbi:MAG: hypothetical protein AAFX55_15320 [Bacteroidota bacterium]
MRLKYCPLLLLILIFFSGCKSDSNTKKDDAFTFIERNGYTVNSYNGLNYYYLNKTKALMDGYYVVGNEVTKWEEFEFKKGLLNGDYIIFHPNGEMSSHSKYSNGKLQGEELIYTPLGKLSKKNNYKNDVLDGIQYSYYDNGKVRSEAKYEDGERIETLTFNILGHIVSQSFIKDSRTITQNLREGKLYSEKVSSNYDAYETMKFFNEDGSTKMYLQRIEENDRFYILELNDEGKEIKRVDVKANPEEAAKYFSLF